MSDLISRSALMEKVNKIETNFYFDQFGKYNPVLKTVKIINCIEDAPTVDAVPVVRGEWKRVTHSRGGHECSICKSYAPSYVSGREHISNFCPNCGADMRKKVEE